MKEIYIEDITTIERQKAFDIYNTKVIEYP